MSLPYDEKYAQGHLVSVLSSKSTSWNPVVRSNRDLHVDSLTFTIGCPVSRVFYSIEVSHQKERAGSGNEGWKNSLEKDVPLSFPVSPCWCIHIGESDVVDCGCNDSSFGTFDYISDAKSFFTRKAVPPCSGSGLDRKV